MAVLIDNRQSQCKISVDKILKKAKAILNALDNPDGELSILIVDDTNIEALNNKYLQKSGPTNVIAFPMQEGNFSEINPNLLGDVVISIETAQRESLEAETEFEKRFDELLVHGILHLFGYDHEKDPDDARKMEEKSIELLSDLKNNN